MLLHFAGVLSSFPSVSFCLLGSPRGEKTEVLFWLHQVLISVWRLFFMDGTQWGRRGGYWMCREASVSFTTHVSVPTSPNERGALDRHTQGIWTNSPTEYERGLCVWLWAEGYFLGGLGVTGTRGAEGLRGWGCAYQKTQWHSNTGDTSQSARVAEQLVTRCYNVTDVSQDYAQWCMPMPGHYY